LFGFPKFSEQGRGSYRISRWIYPHRLTGIKWCTDPFALPLLLKQVKNKVMNIYFEALDSGFIVYKDGKKTAIRYPNELIEMLVDEFKFCINNVGKVRNMRISVSVDENVPTLKED
jgi:hypothetical protein